MKRLALVFLVIMVLFTAGIVPQTVYGDDGDEKSRLADEEKAFVSGVKSRISDARGLLAGYRNLVNHPDKVPILIATSTAFHISGQRLKFRNCDFSTVAPDTMVDIAALWYEEVCDEFAFMNSKYYLLEEGGIANISIVLGLIYATANQVDASLSNIEEMVNQRVIELEEQREAEEEAKKVLDLDDDFCFIATAAYGTSAAEEIEILRQWRDEFLLDNPPGIAFVDFYYEFSPPIADFISEHEVLRAAVREGFVDPVVSVVELTQGWWKD